MKEKSRTRVFDICFDFCLLPSIDEPSSLLKDYQKALRYKEELHA
jgi:hypothetical protein